MPFYNLVIYITFCFAVLFTSSAPAVGACDDSSILYIVL